MIFGIHDDIVDVRNRKLIQITSQHLCHHQLLEGSWGVAQSERHNTELVRRSVGSGKRVESLAPLAHRNLPVSRLQVDGGEDLRLSKLD